MSDPKSDSKRSDNFPVCFSNSPQMGQVAALAGSHMNGSLPFKRTIEQTTGAMPLSPKTVATATLEDQ